MEIAFNAKLFIFAKLILRALNGHPLHFHGPINIQSDTIYSQRQTVFLYRTLVVLCSECSSFTLMI